MNVDIWKCVASGLALGAAGICASSRLPDMSPPLNEEEEEIKKENSEENSNEADAFTQAEVNAVVKEKMCEKLIEKVPRNIMSEEDIRETVEKASAISAEDALLQEEVNIFSFLSWVLFIAVLITTYYISDRVTSGELTRVLRGFLPREFALFDHGAQRLLHYYNIYMLNANTLASDTCSNGYCSS